MSRDQKVISSIDQRDQKVSSSVGSIDCLIGVSSAITRKVANDQVSARPIMTGTMSRRNDQRRDTVKGASIGFVDVSVLIMPRCASEG